ncbi:hypothetical protein ACWDSL_14910 [Streptomyces sp. NPDC000941]
MKNIQAALVFTGGYLVGRTHKMRWAITLAGLTAGRRLLSGGDVADGGQAKSPGLGRLGQELRGELMAAGRSAAISTISNRMNSMSDALGEWALALRPGPNGQEPDEPSSQGDHARGDEAESQKGPEDEGRSRAGKSKKSADHPAEHEKKTEAGGSGRSRG